MAGVAICRPYNTGKGLALVFYYPEDRFVASSIVLEKALTLHGFQVRRMQANDTVSRVLVELKSAATGGYKRVVVAYAGHGGFLANVRGNPTRELRARNTRLEQHRGGLLDVNGKLVSVNWLLHAVESVFPSSELAAVEDSVPKLFVLHCCNSGAGPVAFEMDAHADFDISAEMPAAQPRDYVILRSAQVGCESRPEEDGVGYIATLAQCMRLHRGVPGRDILWLHAETERLLRGSGLASPNCEHRLRTRLFLSQPRIRADSEPLRVPYTEIEAAMTPLRLRAAGSSCSVRLRRVGTSACVTVFSSVICSASHYFTGV
jgi:hypothetical protein